MFRSRDVCSEHSPIAGSNGSAIAAISANNGWSGHGRSAESSGCRNCSCGCRIGSCWNNCLHNWCCICWRRDDCRCCLHCGDWLLHNSWRNGLDDLWCCHLLDNFLNHGPWHLPHNLLHHHPWYLPDDLLNNNLWDRNDLLHDLDLRNLDDLLNVLDLNNWHLPHNFLNDDPWHWYDNF